MLNPAYNSNPGSSSCSGGGIQTVNRQQLTLKWTRAPFLCSGDKTVINTKSIIWTDKWIWLCTWVLSEHIELSAQIFWEYLSAPTDSCWSVRQSLELSLANRLFILFAFLIFCTLILFLKHHLNSRFFSA